MSWTFPRIIGATPFDSKAVGRLNEVAEVHIRPDLSPKAIEGLLGDYQALIIRNRTSQAIRTIDNAHKLQVIGIVGEPSTNEFVRRARARGVAVISMLENRSLALAEQTILQSEELRAVNTFSLRVVPLNLILPHENYDPQRVGGLVEHLRVAESLVNPPVVIPSGKFYVVLDGATRIEAFKRLEFPFIVVQIVSAETEGFALHAWHHAICDTNVETFMATLESASEYHLVRTTSEMPESNFDSGQAICTVIVPNDSSFFVYPTQGTHPLVALNTLATDRIRVGTIVRTLNTDLSSISSEVPDVAVVVLFPQFTLEDVLKAAVERILLPAGITRFVIPWRVLRLCVDLQRLRKDEPSARKNVWLNQAISDRLASRSVRYYQEPVVVLND